MLAKLGIIASLLFTPWALASLCESDSSKSVVFKEQEFDFCKEITRPFSYLGEQVSLLTSMLDQEKTTQQKITESYWEQWLITQKSELLLTGRLNDNSMIGFGVWMPEDLEELEPDMNVQEWISAQGLHLGLGVGEKGKEPRFRFDYRWHQDDHLDMMMQIEVPF
ncbi:hypothetical protein [Vibrio hippocampi]|uniref:Uncharacterized protein n=1 Tax=Vibrio hippocampi TaxID=654686 RepID=A0ABN8DQS3_9VIBR|nr:hypothetical protein [Vibrio hippocampi]CAH0530052.1 hypothetical protein VHP8226_03780 [Vibrio hippocampi]